MPIKYDENFVKRPKTEHEYTPHQVRELMKSSKDINHFIKYVKIVHPDKGEVPFEPIIYDFQKKLLRRFKRYRFNVALCSRQSGKCLESSSLIKIRNKKTKEIEEISIKEFFERFQK